MLITCWSMKGGSGTTVVTATMALLAAQRHSRSTSAHPGAAVGIVDLAGDVPAALGMADPAGPGVFDWLRTEPTAGAAALGRLATTLNPALSVIHAGNRPGPAGTVGREAWAALAGALGGTEARVAECNFVDAGLGEPPLELREAAHHDVLVVRGCYLALRRCAALKRPPTAVIHVAEPGRALRRREIEQIVGVPVIAEIDIDPAVARKVDAGLLAGTVPESMRAALAHLPWVR
jgi:hypothetical protein